jgi:hypothetical protein|tara:strand:- start:464 stop:721 length:258 start_codon:yes stop_codon:yes gene_type:complete
MEMTKQDAELSPLARQLLGNSGAMKLFTQTEFDAALREAKAEIMAIAIQTSKQAIAIERNACADLALEWSQEELSEAIRHRMRPQ